MDLDVTIAQVFGFILLAGIGGVFLTQIFWLSGHIRELWINRRKKPSARLTIFRYAPELLRHHRFFRRHA